MNVLIVEDEMMAQANLARALTQHFPDVRIVGTTGSVRETVLWLRTPGNSADVIFMDVELSDGDCFEIFRQADVTARVIMTTAYDNYAVRAFEVNSIDYLLKPIDPAALRRAERGHRPRRIAERNPQPARIQTALCRAFQRPDRSGTNHRHRLFLLGREKHLPCHER